MEHGGFIEVGDHVAICDVAGDFHDLRLSAIDESIHHVRFDYIFLMALHVGFITVVLF
jgi:hypothetical protein